MQSKAEFGSARVGLLLVMLASVLWGTGNPVAKSIYNIADTNAISVAFLRMGLSVPALLLVTYFTLGRAMWRWHRADLPYMLVLGTLVALYQVTFYASLPRIGVAIATVIALCSAPVIVALLAALLTHERPTPITLFALACALVGTGLLVQIQPTAQRSDIVGGVVLALTSGTFYAINTMVGRKLGSSGRSHPLQTATIGFTFGTFVLLFAALAAGLVLTYPPAGWLRLSYLGLLPTAVGYGLFYTGMRTTTAAAASIATLLEPLTSTLIAVTILHERLSSQALLGGTLLLIAMTTLLLARQR